MNRKIIYGIAFLSLFLVGCVSYKSDKEKFCNKKGYDNWNWVNNLLDDSQFFCYSIEGNKVRTSTIFIPDKPIECKYYNKGDGCADN